jgi:hypothetical protein
MLIKEASTMLYKYPRTYHLPWSPGRSSDDKVLASTDHFIGKRVVVSLKMDGECTTLYRSHSHARSLDSKDHPSRHWLKAFHAKIKHHIPEGYRVCGEDLFALHSIPYIDLPSYFMVFSVWNDKNRCLSWRNTVSFCKDVFAVVPTFHESEWFPGIMKLLDFKFNKFNYEYANEHEGYVIRLTEGFDYNNFDKSVAKYVRAGRNIDEHWMFKQVEKNKLRI